MSGRKPIRKLYIVQLIAIELICIENDYRQVIAQMYLQRTLIRRNIDVC